MTRPRSTKSAIRAKDATPAVVAEEAEPSIDVREGVQGLVPMALKTLADIMTGEGGDTAKIAAAREVLDRAGGKPKAGDGEPKDAGLTVVVRRFGEDPGDGEQSS